MEGASKLAVLALYLLVGLSLWTPDAGAAGGAVMAVLKYGLLLGVSAYTILYACLTRGLRLHLSGEWAFLAMFLMYTSLSVFWSEGAVDAAIKAMLIFSALLAAVSIVQIQRLDEILVIFYRCMAVFVVLCLLAVLLFPSVGIETGWKLEGDWRGIAGQKNGLGSIAALVVVGALALPLYARSHPRWALLRRASMGLVAAICLINSGSRGGLLVAIVGVGSILLAKSNTVLQRVVLLLAAAIIIPFVVLTIPTIDLTADRIGVLGATINTSNRTTLWLYGLNLLGRRELLGFGVAGFWTPERIRDFHDTYGWVLNNFHNGYITILIEGGLVGLSLLLIAIVFIVLLFAVAIGNIKDPYVTLAFAYTNMFLVNNLTENEIGRSTSTPFLMFLVVTFALRPYLLRLLERSSPRQRHEPSPPIPHPTT